MNPPREMKIGGRMERFGGEMSWIQDFEDFPRFPPFFFSSSFSLYLLSLDLMFLKQMRKGKKMK